MLDLRQAGVQPKVMRSALGLAPESIGAVYLAIEIVNKKPA